MSGSTIPDPRGIKRGNYICSRRHGGCATPQSISADAAERWAIKEAETYHRRYIAEAIRDDGAHAHRLERLGEITAAIHDLGSVEARRNLGEDWLQMIRQLREEKTTLERQAVPVLAGARSWDDLTIDGKWAE